MDRSRVIHRCSGDSVARVSRCTLRVPPSAASPNAIATASTSVDFPLPFSPTRKVTPGGSSHPSRSS